MGSPVEGKPGRFAGVGFSRGLTGRMFLSGAVGTLTALAFVWLGPGDAAWRVTLTLLLLAVWLGCGLAARRLALNSLRTLSNLLAGLREGDFSVRARQVGPPDVLQEVYGELNRLAESLADQRLEARDATTLLRRVMAEIDVAVFAFDETGQLRLVNRAGERLLDRPAERILGESAAALGLADCLDSDPSPPRDRTFAGGAGRFGVRRSEFRLGGVPHRLLVLSNLSQPLREEERLAWQRLIRTLGHELNNSLAPVQSIADSLEKVVARDPLPPDWQTDVQQGLAVIRSRTAALNRFMQGYSRLARLPAPAPVVLSAGECLRRAVRLETRFAVTLQPGPEVSVRADPDQLEQALINLLRNAVDAVAGTPGQVFAGWGVAPGELTFRVTDEGHGLANPENLFVPFYTTKPGGTGIGLVLSRQITEGHGGRLTLANRPDAPGCEARLTLPLPAGE